MHDVLDAGGLEALKPIMALQKVSAYRGGCPPNALYAASIVAARAGEPPQQSIRGTGADIVLTSRPSLRQAEHIVDHSGSHIAASDS